MKILEELGIKPKNIDLYETALTHTSYANEHKCESYERLEYLGDAVLELVMSEYLYKNTDFPEGHMTKMRAHYVCENALYKYSLRVHLNEYLRLGHGEQENGGKFKKVIVVEDQNDIFYDDYKSKLQELVQTDKRSLSYEIVDEQGPAHNKRFTAVVKVDSIVYGKGVAHSKKEAEQEAAKNALEKSVGRHD